MAMPPLRRIALIAFLGLLALIMVTHYAFEVSRIEQIRSAIDEREDLLQRKKENVRNYEEKVSFYKTREGIEHLAREQYNLVASGERVILLASPGARSGDLP
ncbi:hypothetical protein FF3_02029 [Fretibacterium fastidiosum]|uniref:Septum formation initiator n=2 Tax=Fretibacterium fastidiosum TaxID=651822 RepID=A0AB94IXH4_9BACT|nr:Septum formation initiator [Fretibacterium fastidiosum]